MITTKIKGLLDDDEAAGIQTAQDGESRQREVGYLRAHFPRRRRWHTTISYTITLYYIKLSLSLYIYIYIHTCMCYNIMSIRLHDYLQHVTVMRGS